MEISSHHITLFAVIPLLPGARIFGAPSPVNEFWMESIFWKFSLCRMFSLMWCATLLISVVASETHDQNETFFRVKKFNLYLILLFCYPLTKCLHYWLDAYTCTIPCSFSKSGWSFGVLFRRLSSNSLYLKKQIYIEKWIKGGYFLRKLWCWVSVRHY